METLEKIYNKSPEIATRKIGGHVVVVPTESDSKDNEEDNVFSFNDMAAGIWIQIDGSNSLKTIKEKIIEYFKVDPDHAEKDLIDFISQLEEANLIYCDKTA